MFEDDEIHNSLEKERRREKSGKYKPLPRNRQTERDLKRIFDNGTEAELTKYLRENGVVDGSKRFVEIVKLFRGHGGKRG
ncbi:MAG: hypothetical protein WA817_23535 [Candidatus Acidiferrum sp.]